MTTRTRMAAALLGLGLSFSAAGAAGPAAGPGAGAQGGGSAGQRDHSPGPVVGPKAYWVPGVLVGVGVLFVAAAVFGPIYRMIMPEEPQVEDFHSHDEPPGASHHHGASGTVDHSAPDMPHHH